LANFNPMALQSETVTAWNTAGLGTSCAPVVYPNLGPGPHPLCLATGGFSPEGTVGTPGVAAGGLGASPTPNFGAIAASGGTGVSLDPNWHRDYNWQYS